MNTIILEHQLKRVKPPKARGLSIIRIDSLCVPDLYIGLNEKANRCLVLNLPSGYKTKFTGDNKENIRTYFDSVNHKIILELLDDYYNSLFNDLIISLYYKIKDISDVNESTVVFINTINSWATFLQKSSEEGLTEKQIRGLVGELVILKEYLNSGRPNINLVLESWTGPYDATYDFTFEELNVEVKTKSSDSSIVRISNEYQLDDEPGKRMELTVVSLDKADSGVNLSQLIKEIRDAIVSLNGDISIFMNALAQKQLFVTNIPDYDSMQYSLSLREIYDCQLIKNGQEFPRVIKSRIVEELKDFKYKINLADLSSFLIDSQKI